jgi:hypothetical protein
VIEGSYRAVEAVAVILAVVAVLAALSALVLERTDIPEHFATRLFWALVALWLWPTGPTASSSTPLLPPSIKERGDQPRRVI